MAGCHWIPEIGEKAFRIQFRGCELPGEDVKKTLSKSHFNSSTFRELIPYQLKWILDQGNNNTFITTNLDNHNDVAMRLLAEQGLLVHVGKRELFFVEQNIWKFDWRKYLEIRKLIKTYSDESPDMLV